MVKEMSKIKSINAYIKKTGTKLIVIKLDNGDVLFTNEGLVAYACQNAKPIKEKDEKGE